MKKVTMSDHPFYTFFPQIRNTIGDLTKDGVMKIL